MRKIFTIIVYTLVMLLIGRNLVFLPRFTVLSNPKNDTPTLKKETEQLLKGKTGNYSVFYADMATGATFGINEKEMFTGASINKVPIIAALYYLESKGKINLDEQITLQKEDIQDYGTGTLRYQKPGGLYSLKTLAKLSLKLSDNTAAYIIAHKIGVEKIQKIIEQFGLKQTDMENNKTTTYDMYLLFNKLYTHQVTTPAKTQEVLSFMTDTDIEDRLPGKLPTNATVYHKTADAVGGIHDVGIVKIDDTIFFLGVLTSDVGDKDTEARDTIASLAKNTYDFYTKRK